MIIIIIIIYVAARALLGEQEEPVLLLGGEGAHGVLQEGRGEAPLEVRAGDPFRAFALGGGRRDEGAAAAEEPLPRGLAQLAHGGLRPGLSLLSLSVVSLLSLFLFLLLLLSLVVVVVVVVVAVYYYYYYYYYHYITIAASWSGSWARCSIS